MSKPTSNGQYKIGSASSIAIAGGETQPTADLNGREGWLFNKTATGSAKFNYFLYRDGSIPIKLGDLLHTYANISMDSNVSTQSKPWITVYTKATGSGDASWYHSKVSYHIPSSFNCQLGEMITCHTHRSSVDQNFGYRKCWLSEEIIEGEALPAEEISYIVIQSDSGSAVNTQILVSEFGYITRPNLDRHISLIS